VSTSLYAVVTGTCRTCAGSGHERVTEAGEFIACVACDGTGDILGALLMRAYELGRRDVLEHVNYAVTMAENPAQPMTVERLRERVG
jgi:hypothetical protein